MENYNKNQKDATEITKKIQKLTAERLGIDVNNVSNKELELAGLHSILATEDIIITNEEGESIWDLNEYGFLKSTEVPDTINPSLWLNAMSNYKAGLFWVVKDKIFQVRGLDIANITFVRTDHGFWYWIPELMLKVQKLHWILQKKDWEKISEIILKLSLSVILMEIITVV